MTSAIASLDNNIPPKTDCSAIKSCGGVRSNSAPTELMLGSLAGRLLGSSAMLTRITSHRTLTRRTSVLPAGRNLGLASYCMRGSVGCLGEKLWISRWISPFSCVSSGGSIVHNSQCWHPMAVKTLVRGVFYTHSPVEKSIFRHPILRDRTNCLPIYGRVGP